MLDGMPIILSLSPHSHHYHNTNTFGNGNVLINVNGNGNDNWDTINSSFVAPLTPTEINIAA